MYNANLINPINFTCYITLVGALGIVIKDNTKYCYYVSRNHKNNDAITNALIDYDFNKAIELIEI